MNTSEPLSFLLHDSYASHLTSDAMHSLNELAAAMMKRMLLEDSLDELSPTSDADRSKIDRVKAAAAESCYLD